MNRQRVLPMICLLPALAAGGFAAAAAQVVPAGPRIAISDPGHLLGYPAVTYDSEGRSLVIWSAVEPGSEPGFQAWRIYGRVFEPDGEPAGEPDTLDGGLADPQYDLYQTDPDVAALAPGRFVAVWSRWDISDPDPRHEAYDVFGQLVDARGRPDGSRFLVNRRTSFWQVYPAVTATHDGFLVAWAGSDVGDQGPWPPILGARRFHADGTPAGGDLRVNRVTTSPTDLKYYERSVAVATNGAGETLVAWLSGFRVFARRYDRHGRPLGPEVRVDPGELTGLDPAVAAGADGRFVVAWASDRGILARGFNRRGVAGPVRVVSAGSPGFGRSPALAADASGRIVAAWTGLGVNGARPRIFLRELAGGGGPRGRIVAVSPGAWPDVAASPDGEVLVVWRSLPERLDAPVRVLGKRFRFQDP